ncbi:MAG: MlaE family ABC transporter permease [Endozoicomonas sp.]
MKQATMVLQKQSRSRSEALLQGSWLMEHPIPSLEPLEDLLIGGQFATLRLVAGSSFAWDSRLMAFLLACQQLCEQYQCQLELVDMPEEVVRLFQLANAVPANRSVAEVKTGRLQWLLNKAWHIREEVVDFLAFTGDLTLAFLRWMSGRGSARWADILSFCHQAGPSALAIISLQSILVGMILAYLGMVQLRLFGAEVYVSNLVAIGMVREMGALMTAIIMSGRTGAGYAAQLGTMQVNEEIDALTTLGLEPVDYLVLPRTLALVFCIPLLCLYSNVLGMLGGGLVATGMEMTWRMYLYQLTEAISVGDILTGVFKSLIFAKLIAVAGCRAGLGCGRSSAAVGQATTTAVVTAIIYLVIADAGLNILFYHLGI